MQQIGKLTDLIYILDRSGSMEFLLKEAVSGLKVFIEDNQKIPGECYFTLVLFDHEVKTPIFRKNIHELDVSKIVHGRGKENDIEIYSGGTTALRDAIGQTFSKFEETWNVAASIMTDGMENASSEWSSEALKKLVQDRTTAGWNINFVGVGIDAFMQNSALGISNMQTSNVTADATGFANMHMLYKGAAYSTRGVK